MSKPVMIVNMQNAQRVIHQPRRLHPTEIKLTGVIQPLAAVALVLAVVTAAASCSQLAERRHRAAIETGGLRR